MYQVQEQIFFVILDHFLPYYSHNNPKNQTLEKMRKTPGDIIILHMCNINDNHMMYGSWDMKRDGQNFLSFWTISSLSPPTQPHPAPKILENQNFEKVKKSLEILSFYICIP